MPSMNTNRETVQVVYEYMVHAWDRFGVPLHVHTEWIKKSALTRIYAHIQRIQCSKICNERDRERSYGTKER